MRPKPVNPDAPVALVEPLSGYADWLAELKTRIHTAQQRAVLAVNRELVLLYWQIGHDILARQGKQAWPEAQIVQQAVGQLPWGHNLVLLTKLKEASARLAYAQRACHSARVVAQHAQYSYRNPLDRARRQGIHQF